MAQELSVLGIVVETDSAEASLKKFSKSLDRSAKLQKIIDRQLKSINTTFSALGKTISQVVKPIERLVKSFGGLTKGPFNRAYQLFGALRKTIPLVIKPIELLVKSLGKLTKGFFNLNPGPPLFSALGKTISLAIKPVELLVQSVGKLVKGFFNLNRAYQLFGAILASNEIRKFADDYQLLSNRIALVTSSEYNHEKILRKVYDIAQKTRNALYETGDLYVRIAMTANNLGGSQKDLADVTRAVAQSIQISGANARTAQGALIQLGQAFSIGFLRGDEFRSVSEALPGLMEQVAKYLKVTRGELRELAYSGKLTSQVLFDAIIDRKDEIDEIFSRTVPTIAQGFRILENSLTIFFGRFFKALNASGLGELLSDIADRIVNIPTKDIELWAGGLNQIINGLAAAFRELLNSASSFSDWILTLEPVKESRFGQMAEDIGIVNSVFLLILESGKKAVAILKFVYKAAPIAFDILKGYFEYFSKMPKYFADVFKAFMAGMGNIVGPIYQNLFELTKSFLEQINEIFKAIGKGIGYLYENVGPILGGIDKMANAVKVGVVTTFLNIKYDLEQLGIYFTKELPDDIDILGLQVKKGFFQVVYDIDGALSLIGAQISRIIKDIKYDFDTAADKLSDAFHNSVNSVKLFFLELKYDLYDIFLEINEKASTMVPDWFREYMGGDKFDLGISDSLKKEMWEISLQMQMLTNTPPTQTAGEFSNPSPLGQLELDQVDFRRNEDVTIALATATDELNEAIKNRGKVSSFRDFGGMSPEALKYAETEEAAYNKRYQKYYSKTTEDLVSMFSDTFDEYVIDPFLEKFGKDNLKAITQAFSELKKVIDDTPDIPQADLDKLEKLYQELLNSFTRIENETEAKAKAYGEAPPGTPFPEKTLADQFEERFEDFVLSLSKIPAGDAIIKIQNQIASLNDSIEKGRIAQDLYSYSFEQFNNLLERTILRDYIEQGHKLTGIFQALSESTQTVVEKLSDKSPEERLRQLASLSTIIKSNLEVIPEGPLSIGAQTYGKQALGLVTDAQAKAQQEFESEALGASEERIALVKAEIDGTSEKVRFEQQLAQLERDRLEELQKLSNLSNEERKAQEDVVNYLYNFNRNILEQEYEKIRVLKEQNRLKQLMAQSEGLRSELRYIQGVSRLGPEATEEQLVDLRYKIDKQKIDAERVEALRKIPQASADERDEIERIYNLRLQILETEKKISDEARKRAEQLRIEGLQSQAGGLKIDLEFAQERQELGFGATEQQLADLQSRLDLEKLRFEESEALKKASEGERTEVERIYDLKRQILDTENKISEEARKRAKQLRIEGLQSQAGGLGLELSSARKRRMLGPGATEQQLADLQFQSDLKKLQSEEAEALKKASEDEKNLVQYIYDLKLQILQVEKSTSDEARKRAEYLKTESLKFSRDIEESKYTEKLARRPLRGFNFTSISDPENIRRQREISELEEERKNALRGISEEDTTQRNLVQEIYDYKRDILDLTHEQEKAEERISGFMGLGREFKIGEYNLGSKLESAGGASVGRAKGIIQAGIQGGSPEAAVAELILSNEKVREALSKLMDAIFEVIDPFIDPLAQLIESFVPAIKAFSKLLSPLTETIDRLYKEISSFLTTFMATFGVDISQTGTNLETKMEILQELSGIIDDAAAAVENLTSTLASFEMSALSLNTSAQRVTAAQNEYNRLLQIAQETGKAADVSKVSSFAKSYLETAFEIERATTVYAGRYASVKSDLEALGTGIENQAKSEFDIANEKLKELGFEALNFGANIGEAASTVRSEIEKTQKIIEGGEEYEGMDLIEMIGKAMENIGGQIAEGFWNIWNQLMEGIKNVGDLVKVFLDGVLSPLKEGLDEIFSFDLGGAIADAVGNMFSLDSNGGSIDLLPNPFHGSGMGPESFLTFSFAEGGLAIGPSHRNGGIPGIIGGRTPIEFEGGEYIVNKKTVDLLGTPFFDRINSMKEGGDVTKLTEMGKTDDSYFFDKSIHIGGSAGEILKLALGVNGIGAQVGLTKADFGLFKKEKGGYLFRGGGRVLGEDINKFYPPYKDIRDRLGRLIGYEIDPKYADLAGQSTDILKGNMGPKFEKVDTGSTGLMDASSKSSSASFSKSTNYLGGLVDFGAVINLDKNSLNPFSFIETAAGFIQTILYETEKVANEVAYWLQDNVSHAPANAQTVLEGIISSAEGVGGSAQDALNDFFGGFGLSFGSGGMVYGPRHSRGGVRTYLEGGEFVMNRDAVSRYGGGMMNSINSGTFGEDSEMKELLKALVEELRDSKTEVHVYTDMRGEAKAAVSQYRSEVRERQQRMRVPVTA